jgi:small subunit ribosomal protein S2
MALPAFTMRQLLEAGVHFGHNTRRWNPKMAPYLFGDRNGVHIIDLEQTAPLLYRAMVAVRDIAARGGRVLFVGTKRQAAGLVAESAARCGQHYVNHRWLGGMMTNWQTISKSIKRLRTLEDSLSSEESSGLTKKELLHLTREKDKLDRALGGIKEMGGLPDVLLVIDTNRDAIAVAEANKLKIPVIGILDSNSDPENIDFPVPGNDDAMRAIKAYCDLIVGAVLDGIQIEMDESMDDPGDAVKSAKEALAAKKSDTPKSKEKASSKAKTKAKAEPKAEAAPEVDAKAEPEADAAPETDAKAEPEAEAAPETGAKAEPEAEAAPETDAKAEPEAEGDASA